MKDRRDMETIHKIQSLAFSLQAHHADIVERDVSLMQENAELKKQLAESQLQIRLRDWRKLHEKARAELAKAQEDLMKVLTLRQEAVMMIVGVL